ncbi:MAG: hypothetical protein Q8S21_05090 [Candidatus Paracaedibacteraceae bacterium]|nr:hypothetical protein [Candidatus Paracaedibacteraceae bacterium]
MRDTPIITNENKINIKRNLAKDIGREADGTVTKHMVEEFLKEKKKIKKIREVCRV